MTNVDCFVVVMWVVTEKPKITSKQKTISQISRGWDDILWAYIGTSEVARTRCLFVSGMTLHSLAPFTWNKSKKETVWL